MKEWRKVKLGDCCEITSSKRCLASVRTKEGIPFFCSKEIILLDKGENVEPTDFIPEEIYESVRDKFGVPKAGDLLLTTRGTNGIPYIYKESDKFYFADGNLSWFKNFKRNISNKYLYYWFKSAFGKHEVDAIAKGTAQKAVPIEGLRRIELKLPPLSTQHRIATTLSRYDSLIDNYQKQIKLLEEAAQRLYKEWFINLRFPGHENTKIVDGVPEGWEKKSITDILDIKYGKDHKSLKEGDIPVFGTGGIMRYVNKGLHSGETVLIPRKGSLNNIMLFNGTFWTIDTMFFTIPKEENVAKIAYHFLKRQDMYSYNIGAAVPSMTINILHSMKLLLPTMDIRQLFENSIGKFYCAIEKLDSQLRLLTESRDRLLPKLLSGEIEV